jgi:hypothetical protein
MDAHRPGIAVVRSPYHALTSAAQFSTSEIACFQQLSCSRHHDRELETLSL